MRFIHAADIHLDSPLKGLAAYPDAPVQLLRTATRDAFDRLVTEALSEAVDFLVIAGDLYDGSWRDFNTGIHFAGQMGRLHAAGIPVYLLLGNHDAENEMTRRLELPPNVHRFPSNQAGTFRLPQLQVALHGRSFKDAATTDNLAVHYPDPVPGWLNIGVLHTALEGNAAHANYAPCSIAELQARGYQYWALGHVHEPRTWRLPGTTIAYPGNLQGRHIREPGPRGALMVSASGTEVTAVEPLIVDVLRWHLLAVDVSTATDLPAVVRLIGQAMAALLRDHADADRPIALRIRLHGASPAHGPLFGLEAQLRAEVLAQAAVLAPGRLWVEKLQLDTTPPEGGLALAARADAIADLQALLAQAPEDATLMQALQDELMGMVGKLPMEVLQAVPVLQAVRAGELPGLVRQVAPALLSHLAKAD